MYPSSSPPRQPLRTSSSTREWEGNGQLMYPEHPLLSALHRTSIPVVRGTSGRKMSHAQLTLSGNNIGIDHGTAQLPEYSHDRALPRRDSTRESDQEHRALKQKERAENTPGHGCFVHAVRIKRLHQTGDFIELSHTLPGRHRDPITCLAPSVLGVPAPQAERQPG